ncbi:MAG: VapC toxin family PIN domain ribonuclease [Magnetococcales bacterium]|nr:VapC toxin family PIN domain ribonuclease [Magnetococcales bacterium]
MVMMGDNLLFLDTNILVYAGVAESPYHGICVHFLKEQRRSGVTLVASRQVMREFMATLSRPQWAFPVVQREKIVRMVVAFQRRMAVCDDHTLVGTHLLRLFAEIPVGGKQVHDANSSPPCWPMVFPPWPPTIWPIFAVSSLSSA